MTCTNLVTANVGVVVRATERDVDGEDIIVDDCSCHQMCGWIRR